MDAIEQEVDICVICGETHFYENCDYIKITKHVPDAEIPSKAKLTLPDFLKLQILTDGSYSIVTKLLIQKGTRFGPFIAEKTPNLHPSTMFPLKIFPEKSDKLEYYLDSSDENRCSWMIFIGPAEHLEEQNLICYQEKSDIFYLTIKDINPGDALRVWYSRYYAQKMKMSLLSTKEIESDHALSIDINSLIKQQQKIMERKSWTCKFCSHVENTIVAFAKHIQKHYVSQMRKQCEICKKQFVWKKSLLRHIKIVHNNSQFSKQNDNAINRSVEVQSKTPLLSKEAAVGGPLLVDIFTDSSDLQQTDFTQFDLGMDNSNLLLDNDNLNMETFLNDNVKDLDHFNFEIDESQKQFVCDICLKQFTKIKLLILHLKQHTGDYTCFKCLKIFCRKENLKSHLCNMERNFSCRLCDKKFTQNKYLQRHFVAVHNKKYLCKNCKKTYYSNKELAEHNCSAIPLTEKQKFTCPHCEREFLRFVYLKRHLKTHGAKANKTVNKKSSICQTCGVFFANRNSLYLHEKKHNDPAYSCKVCEKKFFRLDSLNEHLLLHQEAYSEEVCPVCDKRFKTKKILRTHLISHNNEKTFACTKCDVKFKRKSNLNNHMKQIHIENNDLKSRIQYYTCPVCDKIVKLRSSLSRHLKKIHPERENVDISGLKPKFVTTNIPKKPSVSAKNHRESETRISELEMISNGLEKELEDHIDKLLNHSEVSLINLEHKKAVENLVQELDKESMKEVCLSIPDLSESDQEITLDKNAYIMENGTIVQPQTSDKVVIYVLDQGFQ